MVMLGRGPCIQVTVSVAQAIAEQLVQQGKVVPEPISGMALIDTGASSTCIDQGAAEKLGVPVINVVKMASASHAETDANVYPIAIEIIGPGININATAMGAALAAQDLLVLIGRDVLQHGMLVYNGVAGSITLSF